MQDKNRRRLPLRAVAVFETAARAGGVNAAARLLGISPPAVSRHLRNLEDRLGIILFERGVRPSRPTAEALELLPSVSSALDQIDGACRELGERRGGGRLTVRCLSSAAAWLVPQAARFQRENPDILLAVHEGGDEAAEFHRGRADAALCYGGGEFPGAHAEKLMDEAVAPLCSPEFLARHPAREVGDLCGMELIDSARESGGARAGFAPEEWRGWLEAMGAPREPDSIGFTTTQADQAMRLAVSGGGLVLGRGLLAVEHLKIGNLTAPLDFSTPTGRAYYFVCPRSARDRPPVRRFAEWLRGAFDERRREAAEHFPPPRELPGAAGAFRKKAAPPTGPAAAPWRG